MEACTNPDILKIILFANQLLKIAFIVIPIGLILMIGLDFFKNLTAGKEDDMKKNLSIAIKRIIYCVVIFFVPTIVNLVNTIIGEVLEETKIDYTICFDNANSEYIEERIIELANEALSVAEERFTLDAAIEAENLISKIKDERTRESLKERVENLKEQIRMTINNNITEENNDITTSAGTNNSNNSEVTGSDTATGYLKSPLNKNATQTEFIESIGSNSKTLYYLQDGPLNGAYHGGTDLPVSIGTNIYAVDGGIVYKVQDTCGAYGRHIVLEHIVQGKKYYTIYAHLSSIESEYKTIGTKVNQGDLIAKSGNTYRCGETVGAHLHIGIAYNSNGSFPQTEGDNSFLIGNFVGTNNSYSIVDDSNLSYYKEKHY